MIDDVGQQTLGNLLDRLAAGDAGGVALASEAEDGTLASLTYAELADQTRRVAAGFAALGIERGDRVLVHLQNCLEAVVAWFGLARLGAIFVPSNTALTVREIAHIAAHSGAKLALARSGAVDLIAEAGVPRERTVVVGAHRGAGRATFAELVAEEPRSDEPGLRLEDAVELVFTSGTAAAPKAAMITHGNCLFSGRQKSAAMELTSDDRVLSGLPVFHVNAQSALLAALTAGAPFVLLERYSASGYCERLAAHDATVTSFVGTQVRTMLRQEPGRFDSAHRARRAWFALNVSDAERAAFERRFSIRLVNGYGLTEAFTSVTQAPLHGPDRWPSVGLPLPGREVRIVDPDGADLPAGVTGEIVVGGVPGRTVMAGYWSDPEATAAAFRDGWLHTGDLGRLDGDGYLYFVERKANTIKRAGENIAAGEVEQVLLEHPGVVEAAVVGVPDPIRDEAVKAFVVLADGSNTSVDELELHCAQRLAPFKVPTIWSIRDSLPRNSLGKLEHRRLREESEQQVGVHG